MALKRKVTKAEHEKLAKELQALYKADGEEFVLDAEGDDDTSGLKSALDKERANVKEFKRQLKEATEKMAEFEGIDPVAVKELLARMDGDEDMKLVKAGKIDEVVQKRTEKLRADLNKQIVAEQAKTKAEAERAAKYQQRVLDNAIRAAATKAGLHANAVEDALLRGRQLFTLTEEGEAVQLDEQKHPKVGKDGKTPFSPVEWLESMKETAPHWFPSGNSGGGANNANKNNGGKRIVKRADFDAMTDVVAKAALAKDVNVQIVDN